MMRIHYFQHIEFEGLGLIEEWVKNMNFQLTSTKFYEKDYELPSSSEIDFLIVMGGPMSVNDDYPFLSEELNFIKQFMESDKPMLGVCLGAQLMAKSLGSKVYQNRVKEIGFFDIFSTKNESGFKFPDVLKVLHWHGETFELPKNATLLASSNQCENQAFQIGNKIGLQFHLEMGIEDIKRIIENSQDELVDGEFIQSEEEILSNYNLELKNIMFDVLDYLTKEQ